MMAAPRFRLFAVVLLLLAAACSSDDATDADRSNGTGTASRPAESESAPDDLNNVRDVVSQLRDVADGATVDAGRDRVVITVDDFNQRGTAFSHDPIDLRRDFELRFSAYFGSDDSGGDGMVFLLTTVRKVGEYGCQLGISTEGSVAIEFDTYANAENRPCPQINDPEADHMAVVEDGRVVHDGSHPVVELPNLEDDREHDLVVRWRAADKTLSATIAGVTLSEQFDLVAKFGDRDVYYGVAGGTGLAHSLQYVR